MKNAIAYYRVSTKRQGKSGLGLEAQELLVKHFARANGYVILERYVEVESGKNDDRKILKQALRACKTTKAILLIATLDRLARSVAFIAQQMESDVAFKAVDVPDAEDFILHVMAALAQRTRLDISKKTIASLQAAKLRGVELGKHGRYVLSKANKIMAMNFAMEMERTISILRFRGLTTVRQITDELNRKNVPTFRNKQTKWHISTVHRLLKRIDNMNSQDNESPNV